MSSSRFASVVVALAAWLVPHAGFAHTPGLCPDVPAAGCRTPVKSLLALTTGATADSTKLRWWWASPTGTTFADFGDPTVSTSYAFCLYDTSGRVQPLMFDEAPAATACATQPCWEVYAAGTVFLYTDGFRTSDGLSQVKLKVSTGGGSFLGVKGKGMGLGAPALPLATPVRVQIHRTDSSVCWEASYTAPAHDDAGRFVAHE